MSAAAAAKVLYRGPPGMRKELYYFAGSVFAGTGIYQGYLLTQHLSWPFATRDVSKTQLASKTTRYVVGYAVGVTGLTMGVFFWWSPARVGTRVTLYPTTKMVGIRTSARPVRALLPSSMRKSTSPPINPLDPKEQLFPWDALFRRDQASAVQIDSYVKSRANPPPSSARSAPKKRVPSSVLLGRATSVAFQLEAAPVILHQAQTKNLYKKGWANFKLSLRGNTDWTPVAGEAKLSDKEQQAKLLLHPKDPWFLSRTNFDHLFPTRPPK